jgi:hypothetical protein
MKKLFRLKLESVLILAIPIVLLILPSDFFDSGQSICLSVLLFKMECYACGMTRACMHLIHFEFVDAYFYNPLAFIVVPLLTLLFILRLNRNLKILFAKKM